MQSQNFSVRMREGGLGQSRQSVDEWLEAAIADRARRAAHRNADTVAVPSAPEPEPAPTEALPEAVAPESVAEVAVVPVPAPVEPEPARADHPAPTTPVPTDITASQTETLLTFEQRIKEISDRLNASKPIGRRGLSAKSEVDLAVSEIRRHQAGLSTQTAVGRAMDAPGSDGALRGYTDTLAAMRADLARIMGHVEAQKPADLAPVAELRQEMRDEMTGLRDALAAVASREDVARVEGTVDTLAKTFEAPGGIVPLAPYSRELEALRAEIQRLSETHERGEGGTVARNLDVVSHKIDMLIAGGLDAQVLGSMAGQVADLREGLARSATSADIDTVAGQVAGLRTDMAALAERQVDTVAFSSLRVAVQEMRDALDRPSYAGADGRDGLRDRLAPMEGMLAQLADKIDRLEQRRPDPAALDQLEGQLSSMAATFRSQADDGSLRALEQAMSDLLGEVSSWRQGTIEVAERAARSAVAETLDAAPPGLEGHGAAMASRTQEKLDSVQSTLADVVKRLGELETDPAGRRRPEAAPSAAPLDLPLLFEDRAAAPAVEPVAGMAEPAIVAAPVKPRREPEGLDEADEPLKPSGDEILLEPGAQRPFRGAIPAVDDIKSSFIIAARRAAQAAASDAAKDGGPAAAASGRGAGLTRLAGRLRGTFETHRRQLLIAAAALALAIGVLQIVEGFSDPSGGATKQATATVPATSVPATSGAASASAAPVPDPLTTQSVTVVPADTPPADIAAVPAEASPAKPADPVTPAGATASADPAKPATPEPKGDGAAVALSQAASAGNPQAQYELAVRLSEGRGVPRNPQGAVSLLEKAADKGLAPAQYRLASFYEKGTGVTRNLDTARSWYLKAADGGNIRAMHNLAVLMAEGSDGKPDYGAAVGWFQRAAEFGVRDSQYNLAVLYARGLGVPQDLGKSYTWFALAAGQGDADAAKKRDEVAARLPAAELARLKTAVDKWKAAPAASAANDVAAPAGGWGGEGAPKTRGTTG